MFALIYHPLHGRTWNVAVSSLERVEVCMALTSAWQWLHTRNPNSWRRMMLFICRIDMFSVSRPNWSCSGLVIDHSELKTASVTDLVTMRCPDRLFLSRNHRAAAPIGLIHLNRSYQSWGRWDTNSFQCPTNSAALTDMARLKRVPWIPVCVGQSLGQYMLGLLLLPML